MGKSRLFLYPDDDPDHSKKLTGAKLDSSSDFFQEGPGSSIQTDKETDKQTVMEIILPRRR